MATLFLHLSPRSLRHMNPAIAQAVWNVREKAAGMSTDSYITSIMERIAGVMAEGNVEAVIVRNKDNEELFTVQGCEFDMYKIRDELHRAVMYMWHVDYDDVPEDINIRLQVIIKQEFVDIPFWDFVGKNVLGN